MHSVFYLRKSVRVVYVCNKSIRIEKFRNVYIVVGFSLDAHARATSVCVCVLFASFSPEIYLGNFVSVLAHWFGFVGAPSRSSKPSQIGYTVQISILLLRLIREWRRHYIHLRQTSTHGPPYERWRWNNKKTEQF